MRGKLIVFEGIDGSGKSTQIRLLFNYLKSKKVQFKYLNFPRYDQFYGRLTRRMLDGEFGGNQLSPYLTSLPFAMDRLMARDQIVKWLKQGYLVIADRYVTASMAHQAGKMRGKKQMELLNWIYQMEYEINQMPKEDLVIWLKMPVRVAQKLMSRRRTKDVAERDVEYQQRVAGVYQKLADKFKHWQVVSGVDGDNQLRLTSEINQEIIRVLERRE